MKRLNKEERRLVSLYAAGSRQEALAALREMRQELAWNEQRLERLTNSAIRKLEQMSDAEFAQLDLLPDFFGLEGMKNAE